MGGIYKSVRWTYAMMWIGSLALVGVWPFAGYFSKDTVLEAAYAAATGPGAYAFWLGISAAFLTAFYSGRLIFMTFHGAPRADERVMAHVHESPKSMLVPLIVLSVGAVIAGGAGVHVFVGDGMQAFWGKAILVLPNHTALADSHHVPAWVKFSPLVVGAAGLGLSYFMYLVKPELPALLAARFRYVYLFLYNKWYFDELYDWLFVRPAHFLGRALWREGDGNLIDGLGPNGIAAITRNLAARASALQSGYVYHYAFSMLFGVVGLVTLYLYLRGG